ncbi:MAG: 4-hydroxy-tetrahydrodipicolinate reductase [Hyphomicrobiales bacterium]|nr:4-hydroxy-tetrahydrodipicolinate reductase [Hyphomicrobiales bacterium]
MRLVVVGAGGRMGKTLVKAIAEADGVTLHAALERVGSPLIGQDAGSVADIKPNGVAISADPLAAVLDFTIPDVSCAMAAFAAQARIVHVIGTTGFEEKHIHRLEAAARHATIVKSGNMSLGVNLIAGLVRKAAAALGDDWDIEVLEMHHRMKIDAPSGTALLLGQAAAKGREVSLKDKKVAVRDGVTGAREPGTIGFATLRGGSVIGEHSVIFAGQGERIEISHRAEDRGLFGRGAIRAALWARGRKPGLYGMDDVLGLTGL